MNKTAVCSTQFIINIVFTVHYSFQITWVFTSHDFKEHTSQMGYACVAKQACEYGHLTSVILCTVSATLQVVIMGGVEWSNDALKRQMMYLITHVWLIYNIP